MNTRILPLPIAITLLIIMLGIAMVLAFNWFIGPSGGYVPQPGDSDGFLRGDAMVVLRLPTKQLPIDQMRVFDTGEVSRAFNPAPHPAAFYKMQLADHLWDDVEQLRMMWCDQRPAFPTSYPGTPAFEVALSCSGIMNTPVYFIPPEQLPPALQALVDTLPPAPTTVEPLP
ncbi:MAG: hypothetical protein HC828_05115 [Blastochloris sp.]|nr:hypothetical protein [Blastochloris sp.]